MNFKNIINKLILNKKTLSTMESCTGGMIANLITNIDGASEVFKFGGVTYSNEYKIKLGVSESILQKYSVYSNEVAKEMSYKICEFTNSDYGIGITGKLNRCDDSNPYGKDNEVFISIYDSINKKYYTKSVEVLYDNRVDNKEYIAKEIMILLESII